MKIKVRYVNENKRASQKKNKNLYYAQNKTTTITCERFPLVHTGHFVIETA